jgi:hypothetical protein
VEIESGHCFYSFLNFISFLLEIERKRFVWKWWNLPERGKASEACVYIYIFNGNSISLQQRFSTNKLYSWFVITNYVSAYKTIHIYYLKKLHDLLNISCD